MKLVPLAQKWLTELRQEWQRQKAELSFLKDSFLFTEKISKEKNQRLNKNQTSGFNDFKVF